ncbi:hypothetical protein [Edaphobacter albus]|uniref:hypothetical protein n=1 Tax=Edaphobacter sp. 4G125 TaxID=2763071 RepID=UPI0016495FB7|nr:hypothetical protein [Edaphobacter sp. 4G125]QNI37034.1 hypothetical protein H7846_01450 [Edaphobacter sp. 4G125]
MVKQKKMAVAVAIATLAVAVPLIVVIACGPDFGPDVFVPAPHPQNPDVFAKGHLGVLQPSYWRADKVVAYRYLVGGKLSDAERAAYAPATEATKPYNPTTWQQQYDAQQAALPVNQWRAARAAVLKVDLKGSPEISQDRSLGTKTNDGFELDPVLNCPNDAFLTAKATLESRTKQWGQGSPALAEWLRGQDAVFSNCSASGQIPSPLPANAVPLLRMDREYQIAAAKFYATDYDGAISGFEAVANDAASPWHPWGQYLAARAEVRKAAKAASPAQYGDMAAFDKPLLEQAKTRLEKIAANPGDPRIKHAAEAELSFIQVRLDPKQRLNNVATAIAGPAPDPDFVQHLADLRFLADHGVQSDADLMLWMDALPAPSSDTSEKTGPKIDSLAEWRTRQTTPWLVAALMSAKPNGAANAELLRAAAKIPASSPAYTSVSYQRVRLMIAAGNTAEARKLATSVIDGLKGDDTTATRNAMLGLRIQTATSFPEFLDDTPRSVLNWQSQAAYASNAMKSSPFTFDVDTARAFNRQLPLSLWVEAAKAKELPERLRGAVAMAGWLRAQGLNDEATVKALAPLLPSALSQAVGDSMGFPATLALLRNPGLRPYLEQGAQRSFAPGSLEEFRDNWWCEKWGSGPRAFDQQYNPLTLPPLPLVFLTAPQRKAAADEQAKLNSLSPGVVWVGHRALDYVKAHPDEKDAPEALALIVRATHYGCYTGDEKATPTIEQKTLSKEAFTLLHRRYPKTSWAAKTPYYY